MFVVKKDDLSKIGVIEKLTSWGDEVISFFPKRFHREDDANIEKEIEYNHKKSSAIYDNIADALNWDKPQNLKIYKRISAQ